MAQRWYAAVFCTTAALWIAAPAAAQYTVRRPPDPATGEKYVVELQGNWFKPSSEISIGSDATGIPGTDIDLEADLGFEDDSTGELRAVLRFARKHKIRYSYLPFDSDVEQVLGRDLIFNGVLYPAGTAVRAEMSWKTHQFAYEWDFIYRDRGYFGVVLAAEYSDLKFALDTPFARESVRARGPIPAVGVAGRIYVMQNVSITGQFLAFNMPDDWVESGDYEGKLYDFDLYGTVNLVNSFGVVVGYRSLDIDYTADLDRGDLNVKGFYLGAVARF
jgi:hypothetical protein